MRGRRLAVAVVLALAFLAVAGQAMAQPCLIFVHGKQTDTTGGMPNALSDLVENAWVTRAWGLDRMTAKPFANPSLLDAASRLEAGSGQ